LTIVEAINALKTSALADAREQTCFAVVSKRGYRTITW
jgi:hypothetical protein